MSQKIIFAFIILHLRIIVREKNPPYSINFLEGFMVDLKTFLGLALHDQ